MKTNSSLAEIQVPGENFRFFAGRAYSNRPKWRKFFPQPVQLELNSLRGEAPAGVLFCRATTSNLENVRWLALCFGGGYFSLDIDKFEPHFGMRVALAKSGERALRSVDFRRPEEGTLVSRTQSSRPTGIFGFGFDAHNSILNAISTLAEDASFGSTMSGADAFKLTTEVDFNSLGSKLTEILDAYYADLPPEIAEWCGNIIPVRDTSVKALLDEELVNTINSGETDLVHLAPPEIFENGSLETIKFTGQGRRGPFISLSVSNYLQVRNSVSLDQMRSDKVKIQTENSEDYFDRWTVYKCLSAEIDLDEEKYVLTAGQWYQVAGDYVASINQQVAAIPDCEWPLPDYAFGTTEGDYNTSAAIDDDGLHYYDKDLVTFKGERGRIEFCDLLSDDKHIIHVKKRTSSSTLSHVFQQAFVSAEAFLEYPLLREQMREAHPDMDELIPEARPTTEDYKVVVAIMDEGKSYFPFLSKVGMAGLAKNLRRMGYQVRLTWITASDPN
nr:TIGR04141 family sporadically distributed protein [Pontixanthobacter sp. CEM42]